MGMVQTELDQLYAAMKVAAWRKDEAHAAVDVAWVGWSRAKGALNRAYEAEQLAYDDLEQMRKNLRAVCTANGPKIRALGKRQEAAYRGFDALHGRRRRVSRSLSTKRWRLVEENRLAEVQCRAAGRNFEKASLIFRRAQQAYRRSKAEYEHLKAQFDWYEFEAHEARRAFRSQLRGGSDQQTDRLIA